MTGIIYIYLVRVHVCEVTHESFITAVKLLRYTLMHSITPVFLPFVLLPCLSSLCVWVFFSVCVCKCVRVWEDVCAYVGEALASIISETCCEKSCYVFETVCSRPPQVQRQMGITVGPL